MVQRERVVKASFDPDGSTIRNGAQWDVVVVNAKTPWSGSST